MIIIEGMDNSGKSSLAHYLCDRHQLEYIHSPSPGQVPDIFKWVDTQLDSKGLYIYDRFPPISDIIYGITINGSSVFDSDKGDQLICKLYSNPQLIIYCDPGWENIQNWGKRAQMDGVINNAKEIYDRYQRWKYSMYIRNYNIQIIEYNYKNPILGLNYIVSKYIREYLC